MPEYEFIREDTVNDRYISPQHLKPFLDRMKGFLNQEPAGYSVQNRPIHMLSLGDGPIRVLIWSQMHGNESTCTKAILDLINYLNTDNGRSTGILRKCTFKFLPILNPDGAVVYTRENANGVDLNRDARDLTQPESLVLREVYTDFQPHFCFNMHDQRTIYSAGKSAFPATVSFLSPACDTERSVTGSRARSMSVIAGIHKVLQEILPGQTGRYDDSFNPNCVGDSFQMLGSATLLFEAGHYQDDYPREKTREFIFQAMLAALRFISEEVPCPYGEDDYFAIPENDKLFFDILIHNADRISGHFAKGTSAGILYKEVLARRRIHFEPYIAESGNLSSFHGHITINALRQSDLLKFEELKQISHLFI